jgi:hypothetical protein
MRAIVVIFPRFSITKMHSKMQVKESICSLCIMQG